MTKPTPAPTDALDTIRRSAQFDAGWYLKTYPDVALAGVDPAAHYLRYGRMLRRDPGPAFSTGFYLDCVPDLAKSTENPLLHLHRAGQMAPDSRGVLVAAFRLANRGEHDRAITLAQRHLPPELAHSAHILRANAAIARGQEAEWLAHLNAYLGYFGTAPVRLDPGATLLERLSTAPLAPVTGGPLVSVIMPAWNAEATVRAAARSILNQTWRNLELLIVDDASTDGTWAALQDLAAADPRVRVLRNKVNVGPYVSKNLALSGAGGAYVTGHDADDWAHPQRLETHLREVLAANGALRASLTQMVRMEPNGRFGRIRDVCGFSFDGVTRISSISCLFDRSFLNRELGAWDSVRFGADSEMIARAKRQLGGNLPELAQIGMICMELAGSLTNDTAHGVDPVTGPSEVRRIYAQSWRGWHASAPALNLPVAQSHHRPFDAPAVMRVAPQDILRNYGAAHPDSVDWEPVTAICVSKRPHFLSHVAAMLRAQTHPRVNVIYVAHGPAHDLGAARQAFSGLSNVKILQLSDQDTFLADGLNLALAECDTDLAAKIDDDDFYGPDYLRNSYLALTRSGHDDIALTGKAAHYCYVESRDVFGLRFAPDKCNRPFSRVHGGTLFWRRSLTGNQQFERVRQGTDSHFTRGVIDRGLRLFSADPYDFVHVRYADSGAHTWRIEDEEFMQPVTVVAQGLRLDLAYSRQMPPRAAHLPARPVATAAPQQGHLAR